MFSIYCLYQYIQDRVETKNHEYIIKDLVWSEWKRIHRKDGKKVQIAIAATSQSYDFLSLRDEHFS